MVVSSRTDQFGQTLDVIERFNEATNRHDIDGMMALMGEDVVFESTSPPDGERFERRAAVRACWEELLEGSPNAKFETEEVIALGDRCTVRWRYVFDADRPDEGHVRGVDVFRVSNGRIVEKLSYAKG